MNCLSKRGLCVVLALAWGFFTSAQADTPRPIALGLHPHVSLKATLTIYSPLRDFLEKELGREVMLFSSADVKTYFARLMHGQYDVAIAAPHMARVAQLKAGFIPITYYANSLSGVVIVPKSSAIFEAGTLRGKVIAFSGPYTFTNIAGRKWLRDQGLQPETDIKVIELPLHDQVAVALDRGEADAAIIGSLSMRQLPKGLSSRFRVISHTEVLPSQFFVVNPKMAPALMARIKSALFKFAKTEEGQNFLRSNGFDGLLPVTEAVLNSLDPYAKLLINVMQNEN